MGGIALSTATEREHDTAETLRVIESREHAGKTLAVCETATGDLVLAVERERGMYADGASAPTFTGEKRDRENGTERYFKRSARLADMAHAIESGLIAP